MNENRARSTEKRSMTGVFDDPGRIAPHLDKAWRDEFILEARLQGVHGTVIGDALVTADTHVQESGESAEQAFGDPKTYARETAAASPTKTVGTGIPPLGLVGIVAGLLGMLGATSAAGAWQEGAPVTVTAGSLVGLGLLLTLVAAAVTWQTEILRLVVERRYLTAFGAPLVLTVVFVGVFLLLRQELFEVGAGAAGLVSVALLVLSSVLMITAVGEDNDGIVAPGEVTAPSLGARVAAGLIIPGLTLVLVLGFWLVFSVFG